MIQRIKQSKAERGDEGFSLIELLVVIIVLGILAGIVVFAVSGVTDRGETAACDTDKKTVETAEEAYYAKNSSYGTEAQLKSGGFLRDESAKYNVTASPGTGAGTKANPYTSYTVAAASGSGCS